MADEERGEQGTNLPSIRDSPWHRYVINNFDSAHESPFHFVVSCKRRKKSAHRPLLNCPIGFRVYQLSAALYKRGRCSLKFLREAFHRLDKNSAL